MATATPAGPPTPPSLRRLGRRKPEQRPPETKRSPKPPVKRPPAYYEVAGIRLDQELDRLRGLPVFAGGPLERRPELKVRRTSKRPNRVGFAVPAEEEVVEGDPALVFRIEIVEGGNLPPERGSSVAAENQDYRHLLAERG